MEGEGRDAGPLFAREPLEEDLSALQSPCVGRQNPLGGKLSGQVDLYSQSKPKPERKVARSWEPDEVAGLLESARTMHYEPVTGKGRGGVGMVQADAYPWIYPLIATAALTGARKSEIFGLEADDISVRYGFVFIRPNNWRDLKNLS